MPIFEYRCEDCGHVNEILVMNDSQELSCGKCGSRKLAKMISAHATTTKSQGHEAAASCCGAPGFCGVPGSCCSS